MFTLKHKALKYKSKYLNLKMNSGPGDKRSSDEISVPTLEERSKQIVDNFVSQRTIVPDYYRGVVRFPVPHKSARWSDDMVYQPVQYTAAVTIYHSVLMKNPWDKDYNFDPTHTEYVVGKGMVTAKRGGWADPEDIDQPVPVTGPRPLNNELEPVIRKVDWSARQEILNCQAKLDECLSNVMDDQRDNNSKIRDCLPLLLDFCNENGIKLRYSYTGPIQFGDDGLPQNPIGRTGLVGRGTLGNWGPNHAADPVVCRAHPESKKLQFVLIKRPRGEGWALPGGMVEAGQTIGNARTREFAEEALNSNRREGESDADFKIRTDALESELKEMFSHSNEILYQGVVDDPRNTDNSWMETAAILTLMTGQYAELKLEAGDDAERAKWTDYDKDKPLFASHKLFIDLAVDNLLKKGLVEERAD